MRPIASARSFITMVGEMGICALLVFAAPVAAQDASSAQPLDVPLGAGPAPEQHLDLPAIERIRLGESALRDRGFGELPVLARALLLQPHASTEAQVIDLAVALAPHTPAIRFEAARSLRSPVELGRSLLSLSESLPGALWLISVVGAGVGVGVLFASAIVILVGFTRTVGLHGHVLGHFAEDSDPASWPGVLIVLGAVSLIPFLGLGPVAVLAVAGMMAAVRLRARSAAGIGVALALTGLVLGPGLDLWAGFATFGGRDGAAFAVWRFDRGQPLPGDRQTIEAAHRRRPNDPLLRLGLATAWKREGDLQRALKVLSGFPEAAPLVLASRASNLRGILLLGSGEAEEAIEAFGDARTIDENAAVLYNLSQSYARQVRLPEHSTLFAAARDLDAELVSYYTSFPDANLHRFLIQHPVPISTYLVRGLRQGPATRELTDAIRLRTLGARAPGWSWLLLVGAGGLGCALRRSSIRRCTRCERPICSRCTPDSASARTCLRCVNLFVRGGTNDPRIQKRQLALDVVRQSRLARGLACLGLLLPGSAPVFEGRVWRGAAVLLLVGFSAGLWLASRVVALPFEVGALGVFLPASSAVLILLPIYLGALVESRQRLSSAGGSG